MDCTGCPEFTVNFRIAAIKTFCAHVNIVLQAGIAGFPVRMIQAVSQVLDSNSSISEYRIRAVSKIILNHLFSTGSFIRPEKKLKLLKLQTIQVNSIL